MRTIGLSFLFFLCFWTLTAQEGNPLYASKKVMVTDSIQVDSVSIQPHSFRLLDKNREDIPDSLYTIDFSSSILRLKADVLMDNDSIEIHYLRYPDFITRKYTGNLQIVSQDNAAMQRLQVLENPNTGNDFSPFAGLETTGSLSRGIRVGNNQNAVLNSELDLQITGQLSEKVGIRASIQDANIPSQHGGYSQTLNEFDQIFIELFSDSWSVRAGDVDLVNDHSYFSSFHKKVQGIATSISFTHDNGAKSEVFGAGALVRGIFHRSEFNGVDGNQGPYKLKGPNGELYILVVSGSERVFVNGIQLVRGEDNDYVIDYNAGEVKFNTTYPITSNMRISIEYQYTDRSYTRFIGYGGARYSHKGFEAGITVYSESDAKNQPLQQSLSEEQIEILKQAGDDPDAMQAPSAVEDTYSENKILYKKEWVDGKDIFVFSNDPEETLYNVRFSYVGAKQGDYILTQESAIARIYEYVSPQDGIPQGDYEPKIRLTPPEKLQVVNAQIAYRPNEDNEIYSEFALSNYDQNLYSNIDNEDNVGYAGKIGGKKKVWQSKDSLSIVAYADIDYLHENFQSIENVYHSEFSRDWNLLFPQGTQHYLKSGVALIAPKNGRTSYEFQQLGYSGSFHGSRHVLESNMRFSKINTHTRASYMQSKGDSISTKFARASNRTTYTYNKGWVGGRVSLEDNQQRNIATDSLSRLSHRYTAAEVFTGLGDSTAVYAEVGYRYQTNDSVQNNKMQRTNNSHTYYIKSRIIHTESAQLSVYANLRNIQHQNENLPNENTFNSRVQYQQSLFKEAVRLSTTIESNSGLLAQQEYTYLKVEPGQGVYKWVDYNGNGIQELDEFEIAEYPDEAEYIRVLLPNQHFVQVNENKFSQMISMQPRQWREKDGILGFMGKLHNQTSYLIDRKVEKDGKGLHLNPFKDGGDSQLGLNLNFRNTLYFNRGLQRYTTRYTYANTASENLQAFGLQKNKLQSHQLQFQHKVKEQWVFHTKLATTKNETSSSNFQSRNYLLENQEVEPKISFLSGLNASIDLFYRFSEKKNQIGDKELLEQHKLGLAFTYSNRQKHSIYGEINYIDNSFTGNALSPVAYQMLEALQPGTNFTWTMLIQKKITDYLDINFDYQGRKSDDTRMIHTGSVQLKAYF